MSTYAKIRPVHPIAVGYGPVEPLSPAINHRSSLYRYAALLAKGKRVLDLGCGLGFGTDVLADHATQAYGCDEDPRAIDSASQRLSSRSEFLLCSEGAIPLAEGSVDLITGFELLRNTFDWRRLIPEASRCLPAEGRFLASFATEGFSTVQTELEAWGKLLVSTFPYVVFAFQRASDGSLIYVEPKYVEARDSSAKPIGPVSIGYHPLLAICTKCPLATALPGRLSPSPFNTRDRESRAQALREELQNARSLNFALQYRHEHLLGKVAEQSRWADRLDAALGSTQASLRLREYQLKLLNEELASRQQAIDGLQASKLQLQHSRWVRLGSLFGFGPFREHFSPSSVSAPFFRRLTAAIRKRVVNKLNQAQWPRLPVSQFWIGELTLEQVTLEQSITKFDEVLLYCLSPFFLLISCLTLLITDLCFAMRGKKRVPSDTSPRHHAASVIIPTWNGQELLRDFLPSVLNALSGNSENEIIVVDNASQDGTVDFLRREFPQIRVVRLPKNCGFGGACHSGVEVARNEVVVLLNNDMRVEPDFLPALLEKFSDPKVFAVASQIFFADNTRRREESGLTEIWWQDGHLGVTHHIDSAIKEAFPCAYPGGGSSAFDKRKFLELGGFDELYRPFYYEDTDLGRLAWKRGWKVLYEPKSVVHHNHRGTIGKRFSRDYIDSVVRRNALLYCWKNIHDWRLLFPHFLASAFNSARYAGKPNDNSWCSPLDSLHTFKRLKQVIRSRWLSNSLATISDVEAFRRPLGGYYRDRFLTEPVKATERLNVLFVSPYPIEPPVHGGAVFMKQTLSGLASKTNLHLVSFVDTRRQLGQQEKLRPLCKSVKFVVRPGVRLSNQWTLTPNGVREFNARELGWSIHRAIYRESIDVLQLEYTVLGQYAGEFNHIPCFLFEHDISMQALSRRIRSSGVNFSLLLEYLRLRIYEPRLLKRFARVQVCSKENASYLTRVVPRLRTRIDSDLRAAIEVDHYPYVTEGRDPDTLLFLGSFRHHPNVAALTWFISEIFPLILASNPKTILVVVGSDPPTHSSICNHHPNIRLLGTVPDVRRELQRYSVFICPILSGSGVRVKLLEAFASGIPCVSTSVGAEGLTTVAGESCEIADSAELFGRSILRLLNDRHYSVDLANRARKLVEQEWDALKKVTRLEQVYRHEVSRLRGTT